MIRMLVLLAVVTLCGCGGTAAPPPTVTLSAAPAVVIAHYYPEPVTLEWSSENAERVVNSSFDTAGQVNGSSTVLVSKFTEFYITVEGPGGQATAKRLVWVITR